MVVAAIITASYQTYQYDYENPPQEEIGDVYSQPSKEQYQQHDDQYSCYHRILLATTIESLPEFPISTCWRHLRMLAADGW